MPSKKKSKPSFQVPEELQSAPQAGWVYRSDEQPPAKGAKAAPKTVPASKAAGRQKPVESAAPIIATAVPAAPQPERPAQPESSVKPKSSSSSDSSWGVVELTAKTLSAGLGAAGNFMILATRILAAPFSLGRHFLGLK